MKKLIACYTLFGAALLFAPAASAQSTIASAATPKAVEGLLIRVYVERRGFLLVKRTKRSELDPAAFEREITSHDINNVQRGSDLLNGFRRNSRHGRLRFAVRSSLFTVRDRQAAASKCTTDSSPPLNNCELQTVNCELRTLELTARYHVDDLDPIIVLYGLGSKSIASDRFTVALN